MYYKYSLNNCNTSIFLPTFFSPAPYILELNFKYISGNGLNLLYAYCLHKKLLISITSFNNDSDNLLLTLVLIIFILLNAPFTVVLDEGRLSNVKVNKLNFLNSK